MRDCEEWEVFRGKGIAASTFNKDAQVLKTCFQYAVDRGMLLDNPAKVIKYRKITDKKIIIPTKDQFEKLCNTILELDPRAREAFPLVKLLTTSEDLQKLQILLGEKSILVKIILRYLVEKLEPRIGKLVVPLFPAMKKCLLDLFVPKNLELNDCLFDFKSARKALKTACSLAKLPHLPIIVLDIIFVSNAIEKGIDYKTIANWIGHKDGGLLVSKTYGHLRDSHSKEMAKLMD